MESIFEKLWRLGPAALVLKAIVAAIVANGLLLGFILFRRTYRKRYFAKRDARVFELRQDWDRLISGEIPYETWRQISFDRRIVESIALDALEAAGAEESARLLKFLRGSGLIEKRIFEARTLTGWRRCEAWGGRPLHKPRRRSLPGSARGDCACRRCRCKTHSSNAARSVPSC